jgi:hypothetical protein
LKSCLSHSYKQSAIFLRSVRMACTHSTPLVSHARDHWWTLDFANAFVSRGVNSRGELVPSPRAYARNGAPRRWLGDKVSDEAWRSNQSRIVTGNISSLRLTKNNGLITTNQNRAFFIRVIRTWMFIGYFEDF